MDENSGKQDQQSSPDGGAKPTKKRKWKKILLFVFLGFAAFLVVITLTVNSTTSAPVKVSVGPEIWRHCVAVTAPPGADDAVASSASVLPLPSSNPGTSTRALAVIVMATVAATPGRRVVAP